jgi:Secretion system C-terminal sorting domain
MAKSIYTFLLLLLFNWTMFGQMQVPFWSMPLYFEDAVGHKDTVVLGFDTTANYVFNPQFGEVALTNPFDSIFEVRATHQYQSDFFSKLIINDGETHWGSPFWDGCVSSRMYIAIHAIHQPVIMTWDPFLLVSSDHCREATWVTSDQGADLITTGNWLAIWPNARYACLVDSARAVFDLTIGNGLDFVQMKRPVTVEGTGTKLVPVLQFNVESEILTFSPCREGCCPIAIQEAYQMPQVILSPNPATEYLNLSLMHESQLDHIEILSPSGVHVMKSHSSQADISHLAAGIYYVRCTFTDHRSAVSKFVKQ